MDIPAHPFLQRLVHPGGGGGGQGYRRGLDPVLYVATTIPLHTDVDHLGLGIPATRIAKRHTVGGVGLIDDMGVLGSNMRDPQSAMQ